MFSIVASETSALTFALSALGLYAAWFAGLIYVSRRKGRGSLDRWQQIRAAGGPELPKLSYADGYGEGDKLISARRITDRRHARLVFPNADEGMTERRIDQPMESEIDGSEENQRHEIHDERTR